MRKGATEAADGYRIDRDRVRRMITPRTRAILINSPSNPTGAVLDGERMRAIAGLGPPVISDEIYHGLVYEGRARSILEFTEGAYVLDGFSKRYTMTGWRLGYLVCPAEDLRAFQKMQNFVKSRETRSIWRGGEGPDAGMAGVSVAPGVDFGQAGNEGGEVQLRQLRGEHSRGDEKTGGVSGDEGIDPGFKKIMKTQGQRSRGPPGCLLASSGCEREVLEAKPLDANQVPARMCVDRRYPLIPLAPPNRSSP